MLSWTRLQSEVARWVAKNFPGAPPSWQIWGLIEELGELTHAHLKNKQGIRGSNEKHIAAGKDAIADSVIFFAHLCSTLLWDSEKVLRTSGPEEFQNTFRVPTRRTPLTHITTQLARLAECVEDLEGAHTEVEKDAHRANAKTAAHGYLAGLAAYCGAMGWSMQEIIDEVWPVVRARDWTKNKVDGEAPTEPAPPPVGLDIHAQAIKDLQGVEDAASVKFFEEKALGLNAENLGGVIEEVGIAVANLEGVETAEIKTEPLPGDPIGVFVKKGGNRNK